MFYFNFQKIGFFSLLAIAGFSMLSCIGSGSIKSEADSIYNKLPADKIRDISRSVNEYYIGYDSLAEFETAHPGQTNSITRILDNFNYKSIVQTKIKFKLNLYDLSKLSKQQLKNVSSEEVALHYASLSAVNATILIKDRQFKSTIFGGKTNAAGEIEANISLPIDLDKADVIIYRNGFIQRELELSQLATFSEIDRTMSLAMTAQSLDLFADDDSDGDLIPNIYDAFPYDSSRAFRIDAVAERFLTVAFEDNYPNLGDGDFNDFLARYNVTEVVNANNQVLELSGSVEAIARAAGYNHRFGIIINFPSARGVLTVLNANELGENSTTRTENVLDTANIVVFENTNQAFTRTGGINPDNGNKNGPFSKGHFAFFSIKFTDSSGLPQPVDRNIIDKAPFDPYLYIHNTTYDVHLIGKNPLPNSNNPAETLTNGFRDANGYPRALLVPIDWAYPIETQAIEPAYPRFSNWRSSGGQSDSDWYFEFIESKVVHQQAKNFIFDYYIAQAVVNNEAIQYSFNFDRSVGLVLSSDPRYVYKGLFSYDLDTKIFSMIYDSVEQRDEFCFSCAPLATYPASQFDIPDNLKGFEVLEITNDYVKVKQNQTNAELIFERRSTFGPVDE